MLTIVSSIVWAQKPTTGNITAEVNVNLNNLGLFHGSGSGSPFGLNYGGTSVRGRYFISDNMAARLGLNITSDNWKKRFLEKPDGTGDEGLRKRTSSTVSIKPGIEKHFTGGEKLSTYAGAELNISINSAKETWDKYDGTGYNKDVTGEIKGAWSDTNATVFSGLGLGLNVFAGADYYFMEKVYLGLEFGLGVSRDVSKKVETTINVAGTSTTTVTSGKWNVRINPYVVSGIRLGFIF